jgi:hypothetical protein
MPIGTEEFCAGAFTNMQMAMTTKKILTSQI